MKIGILTQPLFCNYGGILQAYALQTALRRCGHDVERLDLYDFSFSYRSMVIAKSLYLKYIKRDRAVSMAHPFSSSYARYNAALMRFVRERIASSPLLSSPKSLARYVAEGGFEAIVVGSDQVWRAAYTPFVTAYFLASLPADVSVKRIAYAASIGGDALDIAPNERAICGEALRRFDAVSVREASAREVLRAAFGVEASVQLDPTLLLDKAAYARLIDEAERPKAAGLACYILDMNEDKRRLLHSVADALHLPLTSLSVNPCDEDGKPARMDSISTWLTVVASAKFVVTDSFHGCAFSILFNKPFLAISNSVRGLSRFQTLLETFHLQSRLIASRADYEQRKAALLSPIDYEQVNKILKERREESYRYIADALGDSRAWTCRKSTSIAAV